MAAKKDETASAPEAEVDNLAIWAAVEATDPNYTKSYKGAGGFQGTATNATYLIKKATKTFGPVGIGWGWIVVDESILTGATTLDKLGEKGTEQIHRIKLKLWYEWNGKRGEIEHFGQTTFVGKNKFGWYTDEEAPKKSLTDALTKCMSMLGFASDVHLGLYDDNKYVRNLREDFRDGDEFERRSKPVAQSNDNKAGATKPKDNAQPAGDAADGMTDEELVDDLKRQIDECEKPTDVSKFMGHKDTLADFDSLPKELEDEVRAYATKLLKEKFNFPAGNKSKSAS